MRQKLFDLQRVWSLFKKWVSFKYDLTHLLIINLVWMLLCIFLSCWLNSLINLGLNFLLEYFVRSWIKFFAIGKVVELLLIVALYHRFVGLSQVDISIVNFDLWWQVSLWIRMTRLIFIFYRFRCLLWCHWLKLY